MCNTTFLHGVREAHDSHPLINNLAPRSGPGAATMPSLPQQTSPNIRLDYLCADAAAERGAIVRQTTSPFASFYLALTILRILHSWQCYHCCREARAKNMGSSSSNGNEMHSSTELAGRVMCEKKRGASC